MENRKNTILLTVIAVATLLVAVVGATFAYFTAQGGDAVSKDVSVKTNTTNSAAFKIDSAISITADQDTFGQDAGDRDGSTHATAEFQASDAAAADFCYNVTLNVTLNDFEKCAEDAEGCNLLDTVTDKNAAELVFTAKKTVGKTETEAGTETTLVNAQDITKTTTDIKIPNAVGGTDYEHKISVAAGVKAVDNWDFTVTFVNLGHDQNYNAGKTFTGAITFDKVTCAGA